MREPMSTGGRVGLSLVGLLLGVVYTSTLRTVWGQESPNHILFWMHCLAIAIIVAGVFGNILYQEKRRNVLYREGLLTLLSAIPGAFLQILLNLAILGPNWLQPVLGLASSALLAVALMVGMQLFPYGGERLNLPSVPRREKQQG